MGWLLHWLAVHTGTINEGGPYYGFFSGFGSDLSEIAIVGSLLALVRHSNCHVHRCWRLGRHEVEGTPHKVCRRHHPDGHLTHHGLLAAHAAARPGVIIKAPSGDLTEEQAAQLKEAFAKAAKPQAREGSRSQPGSMGLNAESGPVPPAAATPRAAKTKVKP